MRFIYAANPAMNFSSVTVYTDLLGGCSIVSTSELLAKSIWPIAGSLQNIRLILSGAPGTLGSGQKYTFTVVVNSTPTSATFEIADEATTGEYTGDGIELAAGDIVSLQVTPSGTPSTAVGVFCVIWEFESAAGMSAHAANQGEINSLTPRYNGVLDVRKGTESTSGGVENVAAVDGTLTGMYAHTQGTAASGSVTWTVYKNGVAQDGSGGTIDTRLVMSVPDGTLHTDSVSYSLPVVAGDLLYVRQDVTSVSSVRSSIAFSFEADTDGESNFCGNPGPMSTSGGARYSHIKNPDFTGWNTVESQRYVYGGITSYILDRMRVSFTAPPGAGTNHALTMRLNQVDQPLAVTIADTDTTGSDLVDVLPVTDGDVFDVKHLATNTPLASTPRIGLRQVVAAPIQVVTQYWVEVAIDEDVDDDPPEPVADCNGGGTVAEATAPAAGTALDTATAPLAWMELTIPGSPSTTYRWAGADIPHGDPKEARVIDMGVPVRALGDVDGVPEAASVSTLLSDIDGVIRALWVSGTIRHAVVDYYIADIVTVKAVGTPWRYFRGLVVDCQPEGDRQFRITCDDVLTARCSSTDGEDLLLPSQIVGSEVAELEIADRMYDRPAPHIYGSISSETGAWECRYVGMAASPDSPALGTLYWFLVSLGVVRIQEAFVASLTALSPTLRIQLQEANWGTFLYGPGKLDWIEPDLWSDRGDRRWTLIAGSPSSPAVRLAKENRIPLVINVCGYDSVGDASGSPVATINNPARCLLHFLNNYVANDATDNWLSIEAEEGVPLFDTDSFEAVHDLTDALGYTCNGVVGADYQQQSWRDRVAEFCRSFGMDLGVNRHGQYMLTFLDRTLSGADYTFTAAEILEHSVTLDLRAGDVENEIRYVYERNYVSTLPSPTPQQDQRLPLDPFAGDWLSGLQTIQNTTSITALGGGRKGLRRSEVQEYWFVRDHYTADAVAAERLALLSPPNGRVEVTFAVTLRDGYAVELGDIVSLEHWDLPWTGARLCQVRRIQTNVEEMKVVITARDVDDLFA